MMVAERGPIKQCKTCGADISGRNGRAHFCVLCARERQRAGWRKRSHKYKAANPDKTREAKERWRKANPKKHAARTRKWAKANPEKKKEADRKWLAANPEKKRELGRDGAGRRRARRLHQLGVVTKSSTELLEAQGGRCAAPGCGKRVKFGGIRGAHRDHIVSLAKGGMEDDANLQVLCASCNLSKGAKDPLEWAQSRGSLL